MIQLLKGLTVNQWIAITIAILSALGGATTQLTDLFGLHVAKLIVTFSTLLTTIISSVLVSFTSQSAQIGNVSAMPGVDKIVVNKDANQTLAQIAVNPNTKVEAAPDALEAVTQTAKDVKP